MKHITDFRLGWVRANDPEFATIHAISFSYGFVHFCVDKIGRNYPHGIPEAGSDITIDIGLGFRKQSCRKFLYDLCTLLGNAPGSYVTRRHLSSAGG